MTFTNKCTYSESTPAKCLRIMLRSGDSDFHKTLPLSSATLAGLPPASHESVKENTSPAGASRVQPACFSLVGEICCIPGSFQAPWCSLGECGEQYCLVWESRFLRDLGSALASLLDGLVSIVAQEALKYTVLSGQQAVLRCMC